MSTVHVALGVARSRSDGGADALLMDTRLRAAETITSGASSVQSSLTGQDGEVWVITAVTREFAVGKAGEKVAVKDAL